MGSIPAPPPPHHLVVWANKHTISDNNDICWYISLLVTIFVLAFYSALHRGLKKVKCKVQIQQACNIFLVVLNRSDTVRNTALRYSWQRSVPPRAFLANKQMGQTSVYLVLRSSSFFVIIKHLHSRLLVSLNLSWARYKFKISIELSIVFINTTGYWKVVG